MALTEFVTALARLGTEAFGLAAGRAEAGRKGLEEKKKDLEEKQKQTDEEFAKLDRHIAETEAAQSWWSGDVLGFMLGNSDAQEKVRLQELARRGEAIDAELELVRRDMAAAGRDLAKVAKQVGSTEKALRTAHEQGGDATQKDSRTGAVAESAGVEQLQVQQDAAASEMEATAGEARDRIRSGVEAHLTSAAGAKQGAITQRREARFVTQMMRTTFGGLFNWIGQALREVGAPPELAVITSPKVLGTAIGVAVDGIQRRTQDSAADGKELLAERIGNAKVQLDGADDRTARLERRLEKTHEATRALVGQIQENSRKGRDLA